MPDFARKNPICKIPPASPTLQEIIKRHQLLSLEQEDQQRDAVDHAGQRKAECRGMHLGGRDGAEGNSHTRAGGSQEGSAVQ